MTESTLATTSHIKYLVRDAHVEIGGGVNGDRR